QSEQALYDWLLGEFESTGHHQLVLSLKQLGQPPYEQASSQERFQQILNQSNAYVKWREGLPNVNVLNWIRQVLACPDLTLKEAYDTLIGASHQTLKQSQYWSQLQAVNLLEEIKEVKIPIYFATGVDDYICSVSLLQSWVEQLQAPKKEVLILDNSAHYFSNEDESIIYQWMKDLIAKKFPQAEEAPDETTVGDIFSNLLQ
ncbi:MAG: alpha/beta hydrolase, partial [Turicibacter sp.]|nr:alpha/beta hydrolase [Turicibacter sp.]